MQTILAEWKYELMFSDLFAAAWEFRPPLVSDKVFHLNTRHVFTHLVIIRIQMVVFVCLEYKG